MPAVWKAYGVDGDGDGVKDVWNPADAIPSAAHLDCVLLRDSRACRGTRCATCSPRYNAGPEQVRATAASRRSPRRARTSPRSSPSASVRADRRPGRRCPARPPCQRSRRPIRRGLRLQPGQAVPGEVDQVRGDLGLLRPARVQPPLSGERDHADQHLRVHRRQLRVEAASLELRAEDVLDLRRDVVDEAGERAGRRADAGVAHQDAEAVGVVLDVVEQGERRLLEQLARVAAGERAGDGVEQALHLAVDDDGVQALLAAEVLVDDRLGDAGLRGDLLDRGALQALLGEQPRARSRPAAPAAPCRSCVPGWRARPLSSVVGHAAIIADLPGPAWEDGRRSTVVAGGPVRRGVIGSLQPFEGLRSWIETRRRSSYGTADRPAAPVACVRVSSRPRRAARQPRGAA